LAIDRDENVNNYLFHLFRLFVNWACSWLMRAMPVK
jgi:hypothetical protein